METPSEEENPNNNNNNDSTDTNKSTTPPLPPPPPRCSFSTNWTIAHGSLNESLTFETSDDSPIDDNSDDHSTRRKSPLILTPPSADSGPCEIKLSFSQKHEIRQVYVRSTARIYEIYHTPALNGSNEYLCTVRCSIADRGDEVLHVSDTEEAVPAYTTGSDGESSEKGSTSEINVGPNEDDWVAIRKPDSPVNVNENSSSPRDVTANQRSLQEFYEATAEISDADPCITLMLRLLSLKNKGCIYVDEVYVYADPVDSTDTENQEVQCLQAANSAGSSLMAMFVPTILQMSRSGVNLSLEKENFNEMDKREHSEKGLRKIISTGNRTEVQKDEKSRLPDRQDVKLEEVSGGTAKAAQFHIPEPVSDKERQYGSVANGDSFVGRVMEQLISRVSRIEDLCLRFEENMLKPINSLEARLQRVENQLEVIVKNTQYSGFTSCSRFSAPAFSSLDSTSSSFYNDGGSNPPCMQSESEKHNTTFDDISKSSDDNSKPVRAPQFLPSVVVTAPEFSCGEEDEENDATEPLKDPSLEKPKQPLSIDDALAAALAGFSSMTISEPLKPSDRTPKFSSKENDNDEHSKYIQNSTVTAIYEKSTNDQPSRFTQSLKVTAPDFSSEDNGNDDKAVSPQTESGNLAVSSDSFTTIGDECMLSSSTNNIPVAERQAAKFVHFKETSEAADGLEQFCEGNSDCNSLGITINSTVAQAKNESIEDDCQVEESSNRESKVSILDRFKILRQLLEDQTEVKADTTEEGSEASVKDVEKSSDKDLWIEVSKNSFSSVLDFETPILDVKFASRENSCSNLPLEALLTDTEIEIENSLVQRGVDNAITLEPSDLSSVQDEERMILRTNNDHLLVDLESYDPPLASENTVRLLDPLPSIKQVTASLL